MEKQVLFIQGAGAGAFKEDRNLAESLQKSLGSDYFVHYPEMPDEGNAPYVQWRQQIEKELATITDPIVLVAHSVGASVLTKSLTEIELKKSIAGIFLLEAPFWGDDGWRYEGYEQLELPEDTATKLPNRAPIFLYHCRDDETVPFAHIALYAKILPQAMVRELDEGGHQLNNDLSFVARDIKNL
jgi:hypothetical protein